jgi:ribosomal protein S18 acetylase RimI-like enzyme
MSIEVITATINDVDRLRALRLAALHDAPSAFGAKYDDEIKKPVLEWQERLKNTTWCFVVADGVDIGLLAVDRAEKDRNSDCWLSSWWISEEFRGGGIPKLMLNWVEGLCAESNWKKIGLGVWPENLRAIAAYKKLGFTQADKPLPSRSIPGLMYLAMYYEITKSS